MNEKTAYPLTWPEGRAPTPVRKVNNSFRTSFANARDMCVGEIDRLGGTDLIISTNVPLKANGMPYGVNFGETMPQPGVAIYFKRKGKNLCFACDCWAHIQDNMHAIAKTIEALRGISRWGTGDMMESAFRGFTALPESTSDYWRKVFGVPVNCSREDALAAFRAKCRAHHSDTGDGDTEALTRVMKAKEEFDQLPQ